MLANPVACHILSIGGSRRCVQGTPLMGLNFLFFYTLLPKTAFVGSQCLPLCHWRIQGIPGGYHLSINSPVIGRSRASLVLYHLSINSPVIGRSKASLVLYHLSINSPVIGRSRAYPCPLWDPILLCFCQKAPALDVGVPSVTVW